MTVMDRTIKYQFTVRADEMEEAKAEVLKCISDCIVNMEVCNDIMADLDLALDEIFMNIVEHSENGNSTFDVCVHVYETKINIIISDCGFVDVKSKYVKKLDKNILFNAARSNRGRGLAMVNHVMDNFEIFKKSKNGRDKGGFIVNMIKNIPPTCVFSEAMVF